ncbi:hypothetical protein [Flavivirga algicola]|uniref:Secreted protein n=1 Tax=Flavivirga algicola TaxID=2729136 RepID=A0ABX1RU65_9FLAO|nr:hypothetical protein [Flavivirga algicola]NMH87089.1 hypothetical protein [Flavivirga algicola]
MKIDKFTKIVLTVIAVNLTILTIKNLELIPKAYANEPSNNLKLSPPMNYGLVPLNDDGTISVKLSTNNKIDVNIVGIDTHDELDVNIDEIGGGYVSNGGPISVEID